MTREEMLRKCAEQRAKAEAKANEYNDALISKASAIDINLDSKGITLNKNCVPDEKRSPVLTSGVRIGTPAMTTKGWTEAEFICCAHEIDKYIRELAGR